GPAAGGQCSRLGDPHQIQPQVAVRQLVANLFDRAIACRRGRICVHVTSSSSVVALRVSAQRNVGGIHLVQVAGLDLVGLLEERGQANKIAPTTAPTAKEYSPALP